MTRTAPEDSTAVGLPPFSRLRLRDGLGEALAGLVQRPGRSMLTMLGTVLGVGAFVAVLGLTSTATQQIGNAFTALTATTVTIQGRASTEPAGRTEPDFPVDADERVQRLNGVASAGIWWQLSLRNASQLIGGITYIPTVEGRLYPATWLRPGHPRDRRLLDGGNSTRPCPPLKVEIRVHARADGGLERLVHRRHGTVPDLSGHTCDRPPSLRRRRRRRRAAPKRVRPVPRHDDARPPIARAAPRLHETGTTAAHACHTAGSLAAPSARLLSCAPPSSG
ncbi:ABC transporter permease [Streptomyces sp. NPDC005318]|uniref:ABC transporter permease n=1 Tax=Streptomyces sp. NPDC005318 TaxID=3157031 RepID=UPI0033B6E457